MWQSTRYFEDYEKVDGVWKIRHLKIRGRGMSATFEEGWAKKTPGADKNNKKKNRKKG